MGTTGFSAAFSSVFSFSMHPVLGAVLAGLGFWPKTVITSPALVKTHPTTPKPKPTATLPDSLEPPAAPDKQASQKVVHTANMTRMAQPATHSNPQPLRVVRLVEAGLPAANAAQMAGRMVISGRMSDVCAELDRLAA
jgi:hypothetical protein